MVKDQQGTLSGTLLVFPADLALALPSGSGRASCGVASHHPQKILTSLPGSRALAHQAIHLFFPSFVLPNGPFERCRSLPHWLPVGLHLQLLIRGCHHWISLRFTKAHPSLQPVFSWSLHYALVIAGSTSLLTLLLPRGLPVFSSDSSELTFEPPSVLPET